MGLLDALLKVPQGIGKVREVLQQPGAMMRSRVLEEFEEATEKRRRTQARKDELEQGIGLAQQFHRQGLKDDPTAQTAVGLMQNPGSRGLGLAMAADRLDPAKQAGLALNRRQQQQIGFENTQAALQEGRAVEQHELERRKTEAYIGNMSYDNASKAQAASLANLNSALKTEGGLRDEFKKAPLLVKGAQAVGSWSMMKRALDENNELALQAAIVAAAQIQEPGLAVRNDDRIAYSGNNAVVDKIIQTYNTAMAGEGLTTGTKQRILALGTQLAGVHARNIVQVASEYQKLAVNTPGARVDQITTGAGVDWDTVEFLIGMTADNSQRGPGGR